MGYEVEVLRDSVSPAGVRLTTLKVTLPRIVLAEFNTHRMLSRSSASSRAIPVEKRIAAVEAEPFVPEAFGKNQRGMQAGEELTGTEADDARREWMSACRAAVDHARGLARLGVHKQIANRLIEPFCWHAIVVTATEWSNFFALRCHPDAQPEIRRAAEMMRDAMAASIPIPVHFGDWHLPFVPPEEEFDLRTRRSAFTGEEVALISAGRCARVSYLTHEGARDPRADFDLAKRLMQSGHMSPFEHAATPQLDRPHFCGNFLGWVQLRKTIRHENDFARVIADREASS